MSENNIHTFLHCGLCLKERPSDETPASYARFSVGLTESGVQVWCSRHNVNVAHMKISETMSTDVSLKGDFSISEAILDVDPSKLSCSCCEGKH